MGAQFQYWTEALFAPDWTVDRAKWGFQLDWTPAEYSTGWLAESWEQTDPTTYTVHLNKNARWQNKPPVNGREFTSEDVVFNYDRMFGTGHGFNIPSPFFSAMMPNIKQVVAVDKYTVQFQMKDSSYWAVTDVVGGIPFIPYEQVNTPIVTISQPGGGGGGGLEVPEALQDWHNAIGTGAWMLTDYIQGSSLTMSRNPDYWEYDERYPKNKLPYLDSTKDIAIADTTTMLAALRTAKIDIPMVGGPGGATWQQMEALFKDSPQFTRQKQPGAAGTGITFVTNQKPFDDINVRKAMQLAVDVSSLAKTLSNILGATPVGTVMPDFVGFTLPYADWSQDLKEQFTFNPIKAKQMLVDAGYPNGFNTKVVMGSNASTDAAQVYKAFFHDIGIEMEIEVMEASAFQNFIKDGKADQLILGGGFGGPTPVTQMAKFTTGNGENYTNNNDAGYDALYAALRGAKTADEARKASVACDMYALEHHWEIASYYGPGIDTTWWPWLKGYMGESTQGNKYSYYKARWWIDQDLKKSMGH